VGQSFAVQTPDGTPVTSITQNIASGQLMTSVPFKVVSTTAGTEYPVTLTLNIPASFPYFVLSQSTGQTPLDFNLYQQAIAPDRTYTGQLTVSSSTAGTTPLSVPITIRVGVAAPGTLTSTPAKLTFSTPPGTSPPGQSLTVTAPNNAVVSFNVAASTVSGGEWLQVFPTTNVQTGPSVTNNVTVTVNASGLTFGTYEGTVAITPTAGGTATIVPVTLDLTGLPSLNFTPTQLSFAYQTGTSVVGLTKMLTFSTDSTASLFYTLLVQYGSGTPGWLVVNPLGGTVSKGADVTTTVSVSPGALAPGTYTATIQVNATGASNPTQSIPVTLLVSNNALLQIGTPPPPFNYQIGGTIPAAQTITIGSSSTTLAFTTSVSYDTASGSSQWLTVTPGSGTTPATLSLSVNPTKLPAGKYIATVTVTSPSAGNPSQQFQVVLNVSAVTMLTPLASTLTFNYQTGMQLPSAQQVQIGSTGAPLTFAASASTASCGGAWLSVQPVVATTPATLSVSVLPGGIAPVTTCSGTISITSQEASPASITVLLNVSDQPLLNVVQTGLAFTVKAASGASAPQFISVASTDPTKALPYAAVGSVGPGQGSWLLLASGAGTTPGNISVRVDPGMLGPGTYAGTVVITSPNAPTNYSIPVKLFVLSGVSVVSSPPLVNLAQLPGSTTAVSQTVQISASNGGALGFNVFASTNSGGNWLSATPAGATTPASITVTANSNGQLSQGMYNGTVTIQMPGADNSPFNIPVSLTIGKVDTFTLTPTSVSFIGTIGGSNPQPQTVQVAASSPTSSITVSTATATCGGNWFSVSPLSGTAPLTLTVTPNLSGVTGGATCTGTVTVSAPGFASAAFDVTLNAVTTNITKVQNAASFVFGTVSPGELVYLEGTNLGPDTLVPLTLDAHGMVSTKLDDTEVLFDGQAAPLVYVSATKITAIVPYEVNGKQQTSIQVRHAGVVSTAIAQPVAATAPGIFTADASGTGQASAVNIKAGGGFSYNGPACTSANPNCVTEPAPVGGVVSIYGTGEGLVSPLPPTGSVTGTTPPFPAIVAPVTIKLGGVPLDPSDVLYAGPAPTFAAGVIQINFRIPQGYNPGPTFVQVIIGNAVSNDHVTVEIGPAQ
jgi:uncharacterized protein (TIGR03437 family)